MAERDQADDSRLRARARELRSVGRFEEAARLYRLLCDGGSADPWDVLGLVICLRKLGEIDEALEWSRALYRKQPRFRPGRRLYAWCVYESVRRSAADRKQVLRGAKAIQALCAGETASIASPLAPMALLVARALLSAGDARGSLEWLQTLDPTGLDDTPREWEGRRCPSLRARHYLLRTKALHALRRWEECLRVAEEALSACQGMDGDLALWLRLRAARCRLRLGRHQEAAAALAELLARKPEWFIEAELAAARFAGGDAAAAFSHVLGALLKPGDLAKKVRAVFLLALVLEARGDVDAARTHVQLCRALRARHGWRPDPEAERFAAALGAPERSFEDPFATAREMRRQWRNWLDAARPREHGVIKTILAAGNSGFVSRQGGPDLYFKLAEFRGPHAAATRGLAVEFRVDRGYDRKKGRETLVAVDVRPVPSTQEGRPAERPGETRLVEDPSASARISARLSGTPGSRP